MSSMIRSARSGRGRTVCRLLYTMPAILLVAAAGSVMASEPVGFSPSADALQAFHSDAVDTLKTWASQVAAEDSIPGAAVVVVDSDGILWLGTFGNTDTSGTQPITEETLFSIQSASKSFTALGVLTAVRDGLVDLDAPIDTYLPGFTVRSRFETEPEGKITLRHLLSHTAGLPHEAPVGNNYEDYQAHPVAADFDEHIRSISDAWLKYPVGYRWSYSNLGVDLAGHILEVVSDLPFGDYMRDKVLRPIGMQSSTFDIYGVAGSHSIARGFIPGSYEIPRQIPQIPAGGLYASASDMADALRFHLATGTQDGVALFEEDLLREMYEVPDPRLGQTHGYCLGLWRQRVSHTYSFYHAGAGFGFSAGMVWYPELDLGIAVLTSSEQNRVGLLWVRMIVDNLIRSRWGNEEAGPITVTGEERENLEHSSPEMQALVGRYGSGDARYIEDRDGEIGMAFSADEFYPLTLMSFGDGYLGKYANYSEVQILPRLGDQPGTLVIKNRWEDIVRYFDYNDGPKDGPGPDRPQWQPYLGQYRLYYLGTPIGPVTISKRDGYLYYDESRCEEYEDGLFFLFDGEALDFRGAYPTIGNKRLHRID